MNSLAIVLTAIFSAGGASAITALVTGRSMARKIDAETEGIQARAPIEVGSVVVQGAEQAVLTMQRALDAAERRIGLLEKEGETDRRTIAKLRREVAELRQQLDSAAVKASDLERRVDRIARRRRDE